MASLKFYLKRPDSKEDTSIFFLLNFGAFKFAGSKKKYLPLKYYTTESVNPKYWNSEKGRIAETKKFPQYPEFNARLEDIESKALNTLRRLENDGKEVTHDLLKREFDKLWKDSRDFTNKKPQSMGFIEFINHSIEKSTIKEGTKKSYRRTKKDLEEYQLSRKTTLTFMGIDIDFYNDFRTFLEDKKYAPNTIGCRIKNLKTFMRNAHESGIVVNQSYKLRSFSKPKENSITVYLNEDELEIIYNLDLTSKPKLDRVRDLFLIGAYTGLRFSDLSCLNENNIKEDNTISIRTIKTEEEVIIPIRPIVKTILKKYEYNLPKIPSNQKFNDYIKAIAEITEINTPIPIEKKKGRSKVKESLPKYKLISSHTARRSFATNAFLAGVPTISIMMITGHKTESAFMKYIKVSKEENAKKLMGHTFFTKMTVKVSG